MEHTSRHVMAVLAAVIAFWGWGATADVQPTLLFHLDWLIEELRLEEATVLVEEFELSHPGSSEALYLRSRLQLFEGEFELAVQNADLACQAGDGHQERFCAHRDLAEATLQAVAPLQPVETSLGHFVIWYDPVRDQVLIPYADETLERAYAEIGFDLGHWPTDSINVHIYPDLQTLAAVSTLPEEAIETSGTVALCKFNRLMITSPRALVQGYGWRDTLSHEYVHLVVQRLTGNRVPVWLHEALARFEDHRWRGYHARSLPPSSQDLLARRLEEGNLIGFEQMHPSMALLPSQEDVSAAFAEVYTVMEYLHQQTGVEGIRQLVWSIGRGEDVQEAFRQVSGAPFSQFLEGWQEYLRGRSYQRLPSNFMPSLQFMPLGAEEAPPDELAGIAQEEARNFMHLGQLLRARGRVEAAIAEYRKAEALVGSDNPLFQNWLARALLDLGRSLEAIEALGQAVEYYPEVYRSFLHLGEAQLNLNQADAALDNLIEAVGINPFDPEVHRQLSRAYQALSNTEAAERAAEHARMTTRWHGRSP
ncbi:MAG: hypothetical protein JW797_05990 [Bradymonadales bacterium]|nr:hypothetical protein [Bradymonadales bacterium]